MNYKDKFERARKDITKIIESYGGYRFDHFDFGEGKEAADKVLKLLERRGLLRKDVI